MCLAVEESELLQTWLHELTHPGLTAPQLLRLTKSDLIPLEAATDCLDLYSVLTSPAAPNPTNKSTTLHLAALRSARVRAWLWVDTLDMIADGLTKLSSTGLLCWDVLRKVMQTGRYATSRPFKWQGLLTQASVTTPSTASTSTKHRTASKVHFVHKHTPFDGLQEWDDLFV